MSVVDAILFVIFIVCITIGYFKYKFSFWKRLGVPFVAPRIPYGNIQGKFRVPEL